MRLVLFLLFIISAVEGFCQKSKSNDYLISFEDTTKFETGFRNQKGDTVIPLGKYSFIFTDTFRHVAFVNDKIRGMVAINRQDSILYNVFPFDNGPDNPSEGLFRITAIRTIYPYSPNWSCFSV